ncbi:oligopeptide transport system ATP-binding protein [Arboricoccus pini]|uniref:Oligopeptide transport system ATP-binding protein n=1 Tax=Arboricoccus pini TaxID=1963835 RepID=A0A212RVR5_9PROT|nr:ABC transporter ATP-binding protein [Arboricoccus pini]SNB76768.1 oligopeptide transport system ATP-binding protein [Arboricoccus pini]
MTQPILSVRGLNVRFRGRGGGEVHVVRDVDFELAAGQTLALVGESGSGKSVTSLALMRLLPGEPRCRIGGRVLLEGRDLLYLTEAGMRGVRGNEIAMIFQEPMTSLNPVHRVGEQIAESVRFHKGLGRRDALDRAVELLELVGIPDPLRRAQAFPHEMSGGMRQRVMIAIALACDPKVLIADEPTTALDVTIQAQVLELLRDLQARTGMAMLFITHNLGVVAEIADRVMVMYAGRIVEQAAVDPLFAKPLMPYTRGLLGAVPRLDIFAKEKPPLTSIPGAVPDPAHPPKGCAFNPRCTHRQGGLCDQRTPPLEAAQPGHDVRCLRWREAMEAA